MSAESDATRLLRGEAVPVLDGVRGLAVALVVIHNLRLPAAFRTHQWNVLPLDVVAFVGWVGVDLFFALSGLLITVILLRSKGSEGYFGKFYARRFLRIFPLYYLALTVWVLFPQHLVTDPAALQSCIANQTWNWLYLTNLKLFLDGQWHLCSTNHFWSLAVEEQFYLVWPLIVGFVSERRLIGVIASGLLLSNLTRVGLAALKFPGVPLYVGPITRMDPLLIGALVAVLLRRGWTADFVMRARQVVGVSVFVGIAAGIVGYATLGTGSIANTGRVAQIFGFPLIAIMLGALLFLVLINKREFGAKQLLQSSTLRFLGKHSYALYVVHPFLRRLIGPAILGIPNLGAGTRQVLYLLSISVASIAVSVLLWHTWEKQFLKLKRYFTYAKTSSQSAPILAVPQEHVV